MFLPIQVIVNGNLSVRGPYLVPLLRGMPRLLDLSLAVHVTPTRPTNDGLHSPSSLANTLTSPLSNTLNSPLSNTLLRYHSPHITAAPTPMSSHHEPSSQGPILQDAHTKSLFAMIASAFPSLKRINMSGWSFSIDNCNKVEYFK